MTGSLRDTVRLLQVGFSILTSGSFNDSRMDALNAGYTITVSVS